MPRTSRPSARPAAKTFVSPTRSETLSRRVRSSGAIPLSHQRNLASLRMLSRWSPARRPLTSSPPPTTRPSTWAWAPTPHQIRHQAPGLPLLHRSTHLCRRPTVWTKLLPNARGLQRIQLRQTCPVNDAHRHASERPPRYVHLLLSLCLLTKLTARFLPLAHPSLKSTPLTRLTSRPFPPTVLLIS